MRDPVLAAADGHTYERGAMMGWLAGQRDQGLRSPVTGEPLLTDALLPNNVVSELLSICSGVAAGAN